MPPPRGVAKITRRYAAFCPATVTDAIRCHFGSSLSMKSLIRRPTAPALSPLWCQKLRARTQPWARPYRLERQTALVGQFTGRPLRWVAPVPEPDSGSPTLWQSTSIGSLSIGGKELSGTPDPGTEPRLSAVVDTISVDRLQTVGIRITGPLHFIGHSRL